MSCIVCNKQLKKNATKFCSKKCEKDFQYKTYINNWIDNKEIGTINKKPKPSKHIYRYFKEQKQICSLCGISNIWNNLPITLEIDHIDGNRQNNLKSNLRLLCPNCHSQTNTFRNKPRSHR